MGSYLQLPILFGWSFSSDILMGSHSNTILYQEEVFEDPDISASI